MKKVARIIKAVLAATRRYDVAADHAFSRESIEAQKVVSIAAEKEAAKASARKARKARRARALSGKRQVS